MPPAWPLQSECDSFYGNPRAAAGGHADSVWMKRSLVLVPVPWRMTMDGAVVSKVLIHAKCSASLKRIFDRIAMYNAETEGFDLYSGSFCFRPMRNSQRLSMHAYGCAIDFDAGHNPFQSKNHKFSATDKGVECFEAEGWTWGGRWKSPDAMHFQAARVV